MQKARASLRGFRQATILAVAITGFLLLLFAPGGETFPEETPLEERSAAEEPVSDLLEEEAEIEPLLRAALEELRIAGRSLWRFFFLNLPKFLVSVAVILLAWLFSRLLRKILRRLFGEWERGTATSVIVMGGFWLVSFGVAVSILAGDFRALVGSLGLFGLALSWALQTPIESLSGWILNSFKRYYKIGDRIAVGDIFGDVYKIDVLTTTIWEIGGPDRPPGQVRAEQPTGRLITFPNNEILAGSVINLTRDFPYVWYELEVSVANESNLGYALAVLEPLAHALLGESMKEPAYRYEAILKEAGLDTSVPDLPQLYLSLADSWVNITIRYLVDARQRRIWKSELTKRVIIELNRPEHAGKVISAYHRRQVQLLLHSTDCPGKEENQVRRLSFDPKNVI